MSKPHLELSECKHCGGVAGADTQLQANVHRCRQGGRCNPRGLQFKHCLHCHHLQGSLLPQQNLWLPAGVGQVTYSCSDGSDEATCENTCDQISLMDTLCYCGSTCANVTQVGLLDFALCCT